MSVDFLQFSVRTLAAFLQCRTIIKHIKPNNILTCKDTFYNAYSASDTIINIDISGSSLW